MDLKNIDFSQQPKLLINGQEYEFDQQLMLTDHVFNNAGSKLKLRNVYPKNYSVDDLFNKPIQLSDFAFCELYFGSQIFYAGFIKSQSNNSLNSFIVKKIDVEIVSLKELLIHQPMDFAIYKKDVIWVIDQIIERLKSDKIKKGNLAFDTIETIVSYNTKDMSAYDVLRFIEKQTDSYLIIDFKDGQLFINFYSDTSILESENEKIGIPISYDTEENINNFNTLNEIIDIKWNKNNSQNYNAIRVESEKTISNISRRIEISLTIADDDFTFEYPIGKIDFDKVFVYNNDSSKKRQLIIVQNDLAEKGYNYDISYTPFSNTISIHPRIKKQYPNGKIVFYYFPILRQDIDFENNDNQMKLGSNINSSNFKIFRYEKYNDLTNLEELIRQGKSLLNIGSASKATLTVFSKKSIWNLGESVEFIGGDLFKNFTGRYIIKTVELTLILANKSISNTFKYTLADLRSLETELNYFDPQFFRDNPLLNNDTIKIDISKSINVDFNLIVTDFKYECLTEDDPNIPSFDLGGS